MGPRDLPATEEYFQRRKDRGTLQSWCKICQRRGRLRSYWKNPDRERENARLDYMLKTEGDPPPEVRKIYKLRPQGPVKRYRKRSPKDTKEILPPGSFLDWWATLPKSKREELERTNPSTARAVRRIIKDGTNIEAKTVDAVGVALGSPQLLVTLYPEGEAA